MGMKKIQASYKVEIWDGTEDKEKRSKGLVKASVSFDTVKPQCSRCLNPNRRVVVVISSPKGYSKIGDRLRLCMDCLTDLVEGVNIAMQEYKLIRLVLTGEPVGNAIQKVLGGEETSVGETASLQEALDHLVGTVYAATGDTAIEVLQERRSKDVTAAFDDKDFEYEDS